MVSARPVLSSAGLRIECEVGGGVGGGLKLQDQRQGLGVDQRGGSLHQGQSIFEAVSLFTRHVISTQASDLREIIVLLSERIVHEVEECDRARHETVADMKAVGGFEQSPLEPAVLAERAMKAGTPEGIA